MENGLIKLKLAPVTTNPELLEATLPENEMEKKTNEYRLKCGCERTEDKTTGRRQVSEHYLHWWVH